MTATGSIADNAGIAMEPTGWSRLPWRPILCWVLAATALAWIVGFAAGTVVRLMVPWMY